MAERTRSDRNGGKAFPTIRSLCYRDKTEIVRTQRKTPTTDVAPTLPLYRSAPALQVRLEDFELFAIDRLRVLKGISDGLSRGRKPEGMEKLV
ncbi:hypothetical protein HHK36_007594 [Tetracentron sinense]|uniref:Uncharacterized protein n=1 Tax=Tetracentron sinense TaxID=13715 RepID=A0A834ZS28_TETSI|nr:hypothetical protein HHK36_007594 [Tetracentron sinense]